jgi:hypothetical protein
MMPDIPLIEWIGYLASILIALSLTMNSIVKLRWINLVGAALFSVYGFIIGALPVGLLNGFIAVVNVVYLIRLSNKKDAFRFFKTEAKNPILNEFLEFHKEGIQKLAPGFQFQIPENASSYLILRNMDVAGILIGKKETQEKMHILLDYVSPRYRDFKLGKSIYQKDSKIMQNEGVSEVVGKATTKAYRTYYDKMGFEKVEETDQEVNYRLTV